MIALLLLVLAFVFWRASWRADDVMVAYARFGAAVGCVLMAVAALLAGLVG